MMGPRIAVVGAGKFGSRHIATLARLQSKGLCNLVAVVDAAATQLRKLDNFECRLESSLSNVLPDVDVVDIVTPASTHYELANQCLINNKNIIVEKPLAVSYKEAAEIHRLGRQKNLLVGVGHVFRYHPISQRLKQMVDSGGIGEINMIEGQFLNPNQPRTDVGSILNYSHFIDLCNYLMGCSPIDVTATISRSLGSAFESDAVTIFDYPRMTRAMLHVGWAGRRKRRYLAVEGSLATVTADYLSPSLEVLKGDSNSIIGQETIAFEEAPTSEPLYLELSDFLNCAITGNRPLADSLSGVISVYLCQRALQSASEHRTLSCDIQANLTGTDLSSTESIAAR